MTSYSLLIETMHLSCTVFKIRRLNPTPPPFGAPVGGDPVRISKDFWHQKTTFPGLSCGVVCMILRFAVLVQH